MPKSYKVWIEVEEIDEDNDKYETLDLPFGACAEFDSLEDATKYAQDLYDISEGLPSD